MSDGYTKSCGSQLKRRCTDKKDDVADGNVCDPDSVNMIPGDKHNGFDKDKIRILIAIKQTVLRYGLASLLREQPDFAVVGTVGDCQECHLIAPELSPHVLLCDLNVIESLPVVEPESTNCPLEVSCDVLPDIPAILLQDDRSEHQILQATRIGVRGYLTTNSRLEDLFKAIRVVKEGGAFLERHVQSKVLGMLGKLHNGNNTKDKFLTDRERLILRLLAQGKRNQEIADTIFLSNSSVKRYVSSLYTKLGATNRAEAVSIGISQQLINIE